MTPTPPAEEHAPPPTAGHPPRTIEVRATDGTLVTLVVQPVVEDADDTPAGLISTAHHSPSQHRDPRET